MTKYITRANHMIDTLAIAGEKHTDGEVILTVLGGLDPEYEAFVTSIITRFNPTITFVDLQTLLMD